MSFRPFRLSRGNQLEFFVSEIGQQSCFGLLWQATHPRSRLLVLTIAFSSPRMLIQSKIHSSIQAQKNVGQRPTREDESNPVWIVEIQRLIAMARRLRRAKCKLNESRRQWSTDILGAPVIADCSLH